MPVIGLNLGRRSFKAVELEKKKDKYELVRYGVYDNPDLNLNSELPDDVKAFSRALQHFFAEYEFTSRDVVVGLDEKHVYMRIVSFPAMKDKELANSIKYEAQQYIPLPLTEVNLSYQKIQGGYVERGKTNVQLVAAKKTVLDRYVKIVKDSKMSVHAIEPEAIALGRALGDSETAPMGTVVLDIGHTSTLILVAYAGVVQFTRTVQIGGDIISKTLQQNLNLDITQAEEYKKVYGMDPQYADGKVMEVIKPMIDNILSEVKRAVVFFTNSTPSANIRKVVLSGGSALMPGLLPYVANNIDSEVELANPLRDIVFSEKNKVDQKNFTEQAPLYSIAIGLAKNE